MRFAIAISRFNTDVTEGLLKGAIGYLKQKKITVRPEDIFWVPGAFELPLVAKKLAKQKNYHGVICLGCVIKGDTMHFEYISLAATMGILQSSLETEKPIAFGILTTLNEKQAIDRSQDNAENKGIEAAASCWETAQLLSSMTRK